MEAQTATTAKRIRVRTMSDEQRDAARSWFQLAVNVGATLAMAIAAWSFNQTMALRSEVDTMKASRFTAENGLEVWKEISALKQSIVVLPSKDDVRAIEERQRQTLERLISIEAAVKKMGGSNG